MHYLFLLLLLASFPTTGYAGDLAFCKDIADGDTLFVKISNRMETIRLIGIDTPEIEGKYVSAEFFGKEASEYTGKLVIRKKIRLEYDSEKKDKYNRLLAYVYLPDGRMLNKLLIKNGYARVYKFFRYKNKKEFMKLEQAAKAKCLGLWKKHCN